MPSSWHPLKHNFENVKVDNIFFSICPSSTGSPHSSLNTMDNLRGAQLRSWSTVMSEMEPWELEDLDDSDSDARGIHNDEDSTSSPIKNNNSHAKSSAFDEAAALIAEAIAATPIQEKTVDVTEDQAISHNIAATLNLRPKSFFISWNGVICLVLHGFPLQLELFKRHLNEVCASHGYKRENFGSQWAKITLAFVNEHHAANSPLSLEEFRALKQICIDCSAAFEEEGSKTYIPVDGVSLVEYQWRTLEKVTQVKQSRPQEGGDGDGVTISPEQIAKTNKVLSEWDEEEEYLDNVNAVGAPYRESGSSSTPGSNGLTCVSFIKLKCEPRVWKALSMLRERVDEKFPSRYEWIKDDSLHCTIRAMDKEIWEL